MTIDERPDPTHVRESLRIYAGPHALATYDQNMAELAKFRREKARLCVCRTPNPGPNLIACQSCGCTL